MAKVPRVTADDWRRLAEMLLVTKAAELNLAEIRERFGLADPQSIPSAAPVKAPYCNVCGESGTALRTAVEVCRDCYDRSAYRYSTTIPSAACGYCAGTGTMGTGSAVNPYERCHRCRPSAPSSSVPTDRERVYAAWAEPNGIDAVLAFIADVRHETIEACAKVCEGEGNRLRAVSHYEDRAQTAWECARRIRDTLLSGKAGT